MILLSELVKRSVISSLEAREILLSLDNSEYVDVDEALIRYKTSYEDIAILRSDLYSLSIYDKPLTVEHKLNYFDIEDMRKYLLLPISFIDNTLSIGIVDPARTDTLEFIENVASRNKIKYVLYILPKDKFTDSISKTFDDMNLKEKLIISANEGGLVLSDVNKPTANMDKQMVEDISEAGKKLSDNIEDESIDDIVNNLLYNAIANNASDIHVEHVGQNVRVRDRVDGSLSEVLTLPANMHASLTARIKILCNMKLDEKRKPQDGRFSIRLDNHKVDFRVSSMPGYYGEKIVMRILDSYRGVRKLEDIGFSIKHLDQIRKALQRPYGMVLISGPTGSGKTTTLYSMINEIDRETSNVPSMNQSQIFPEIGYTFANGLRSILRQDPDVIMVGEIRDSETAQLAVQAALTGHLVFSTIHTNNSVGVITRLIDMGVDPFLIAPTLCLSIAQRLVPQIYPKCESKIEMTEGIKAMVLKNFETLPDEYKSAIDLNRPLYEAIPSSEAPSGTKGRMPVLEILDIDNEIQQAIITKKSEEELWTIARKKGMLTMREDAILKSMNGKVPFVEINGL
jgi:type IV pilus assembly protein PilB